MSSPKRRRIAEGDSLSTSLVVGGTPHSEKPLEEGTELVEAQTDAMVLPEEILPEFDDFSEILIEDLQKTDSALVAAGLEKLLTLLGKKNGARKYQKRAYSLGAHTIVSLVMKRWPSIETIQASGCQCLGYLAYYKTLPAVRCGCVEAIVYAMKAYPNSPLVQSGGCCVLMNTISGCETKHIVIKRVTYRFVKEMDGIPLVLKALEKFSDDEDVRQCGLGVFVNLSLDSLLQDPLKKAGVLMAALGVLNKYPDDELVKEFNKNIVSNIFG